MSSPEKSEIIYQIYPKSFQDTNGDGLGDLQGIIDRLDYIKSLGVTMIWLNPIFESPHVDNGYDVSDYYTIDSKYGDELIVDRLIEAAHANGLKVMFDLVLNHTSTKHWWFQEALEGPNNRYRDYYIWKKSARKDHPPNNWASFFGGSVWELIDEDSMYYFHLFDKEMPDLNWRNPNVREEMIRIALYWLDKGVDGFRLDAFIHLEKEHGYPDVPYADPGQCSIAEEYYANLPKVDDYIKEFVLKIKKHYPNVYILGEAASADPDRGVQYTLPRGEACNSIVSFRYFPMKDRLNDEQFLIDGKPEMLDVKQFKQVMAEWQSKLGEISEPTLYLNNHDMPRAVSRLGDAKKFREDSAKTLATVMYLQKGVPVILNGEEIGMKNLEVKSWENSRLKNGQETVNWLIEKGVSEKVLKEYLSSISINASRGAMQWTDGEFAGFSTEEPWSGVNRESHYNVAAQASNTTSILSHYRILLNLKKRALFSIGNYEMYVVKSPILAYGRQYKSEKAIIIANLSDETQTSEIKRLKSLKYEILLQTGTVRVCGDTLIELAPFASIVLIIKEKKEKR
ncbi:alpha-glucosidase [Amphibacillus marinus]|uniref:Alpha-glucosidase n=1 Tax=Amphibacillus marinus TaxID=872970 RepID=A0A1H8MVI8_9BACI|nr:alpha-glucosidase [Amphibacillus marinus]SEO21289.1 alpha-glucosidase [Amphibacillus marinus]